MRNKKAIAPIPAVSSGDLVELSEDYVKNSLTLIPNSEKIREFVDDNVDHLPTDILKVVPQHDGSGLDQRRHNVWGDIQTLVELLEHQLANGWKLVDPEEIAALTEAPILESPSGAVYYHARYQVESAAQELVEGRNVVFDGAPENKRLKLKSRTLTPTPTTEDIAKKEDQQIESVKKEEPMNTPNKSAKKAADPKEDLAPATPPIAEETGNPFAGWSAENLLATIQEITSSETFATNQDEQRAVELMTSILKTRPVVPSEETKTAGKIAMTVKHKPGHKDSKGNLAEWVAISDAGKIHGAYKTKDEALKGLKAGEWYKEHKATAKKAALDTFTDAYIKAALWSSTDYEGNPLENGHSIHDIDHEMLAKAVEDCNAFKTKADNLINPEHYRGDVDPEEQAGHDFWLTRNGHGAGFWDGDWDNEAGEKLTSLAKSFGEVNLEVGDDNKIHELGLASKVANVGGSGGGYTYDQDTAKVLEGDQSVAGQKDIEDHTGISRPETKTPSQIVNAKTALVAPIDGDNAEVLEGEKDVMNKGTGEENNTGVNPFSEESVDDIEWERPGFGHSASLRGDIDQDNAKVLEGDNSVMDKGTGEENNTGEDLFQGDSARKFAAALPSLDAAIKMVEGMVASLKDMYLDAKRLKPINDTRLVRDGVEGVYTAMQIMSEAHKTLLKQKSNEVQEEKIEDAAKKRRDKKSSLLGNLKIAQAETGDFKKK